MAAGAYAASCGDKVQPKTTLTLTSDMSCPGNGGWAALIIPYGDATINLNGHTITCTGANCGRGSSSIGIVSTNNYIPNVKIVGPGKIIGFGTGIQVAADAPHGDGTGASISQVTIGGQGTTGIYVQNSGAPSCGTQISNMFTQPPPSFSIVNNQVSGQVQGIYVVGSHCGEVKGNLVADNNGYIQAIENVGVEVHGDYNEVSSNTLAHNGFGNNESWLGGGMKVGGNHNVIVQNYLTTHHAYGILLGGSANSARLNTSRFTTNGYDMVDYATGTTWNANNVCNTQNGLPAGICAAGE